MKNVAYYLFSHNALYTFVADALTLVEKTNTEELGLKVLIENTKTEFSKFDQALKRNYVNPFTQLIIAADQKRDDRFIGFKAYLTSCRYRKDETWVAAAEELEALVNKYGTDLYKMSFAEESAALDNLIAELQADPFKTAIETLQAKSWFDEVVEAQQEFKTLNQERSETSETNTNTIGDSRKPLIRAIKSLLALISLLEQSTANPVLTDLVEQLNNHIAKSMASARLSHSLNEKEEITEKTSN